MVFAGFFFKSFLVSLGFPIYILLDKTVGRDPLAAENENNTVLMIDQLDLK